MKYLFTQILRHPLLFLLLFYFITHLINLTAIPIFNDESIYLDWGWRETHTPGYLYYSLYDGKQPLLMWLFGIAAHILPDPLFAGRFISVICGALTLIGVYTLTLLLLTRKAALTAAFFYCIIPLTVFYNRMALMESAISCVFIWMLYTFFALLKTGHMKYAYLLGCIAGIGFFIKSTPLLLFGILLLLLFGIGYFDNKPKLYAAAILFIGITTCIDLLLLINPQFWQTLPLSNRYILSIQELLTTPAFFHNSIQTGYILFILTTPLALFCIGKGMISLYKKGSFSQLYTIIIFVLFCSELLISRSANPRYLAPFFVPFYIPLVAGIFCKKAHYTKILFTTTAIIPIVITLCLLLSPATFTVFANRYSPFLDGIIYQGHTNGYGISEVIQFLEKKAKQENIMVTYAQNTGNPENAMIVYFEKKATPMSYFDNALVGIKDPSITCLSFPKQKIYFVSRNDQRVGLDKFLVLVKKFPKPQGTDFIGVYTLKTQCKGGKTVQIHLQAY